TLYGSGLAEIVGPMAGVPSGSAWAAPAAPSARAATAPKNMDFFIILPLLKPILVQPRQLDLGPTTLVASSPAPVFDPPAVERLMNAAGPRTIVHGRRFHPGQSRQSAGAMRRRTKTE